MCVPGTDGKWQKSGTVKKRREHWSALGLAVSCRCGLGLTLSASWLVGTESIMIWP